MFLENFERVPSSVAHPLAKSGNPFGDFLFISQNKEVRFLAEACIDVLRGANRLTGRKGYSWRHLTQQECLNSRKDGLLGPDQTLVLVGGTDTPWQPDDGALTLWRGAIREATRLCVIGSAVFVPLAAGVLSAKRLAVHPAFRAGVEEARARPEIVESATCHHKALSSASGHVAAVRMMVDLVGARDGEFTRIALARDLGLIEPQANSGSAEHWRLRRKAQGDEVICEALQIMDDHLEDTLTVGQVAELLQVSPRKLERGFNDLLGQTPLKVYRDLRLERAHKLLAQTSMPVGEVSVACGFSNVTLMKKWFQLKYGANPSEVRQMAFGVRSKAS